MSIRRTQIEEDYGRAFTEEEWQTIGVLDDIAERLANLACRCINQRAGKLPRNALTYNEQWTLEKLIRKLEARV